MKSSHHLIIVHIDQATDDEGWTLIKARADKRWSLADATSFIIMGRLGLTEALTTDHHFARANFVCVPNLPH